MSAARYSQVLGAVWRQRDLSSPWGRRVIAALMVLTGVAGLIWLSPEAAWRLVAVELIVVVLGIWMAVSSSLLEQNHPTAARCVPGHARTLKRAAMLGWALCTALFTLLTSAMLPAAGFWPLLLLCSGFLSAFLLWTARLAWLWLPLILVSPLSLALGGRLAPARQALAALWQSHPYEMLLLGLAFQAWLVTRAIADGGAKHQAVYKTQALMRRAAQMQLEGKPMPIDSWAPFGRLTRPFTRILSAWLQHLLDRADNRKLRSVMARAEIVLHGGQHWLRYALAMGVIATLVLVAFTVVLGGTGVSLALILKHGAFGMGIGIASAGLNPGLTTPNMLWQSRREQALLRLLPGMPQGQALNLAVARLPARDFIVNWLLTTAALLALGAAAGNQWLLCLPLAALPVATLTLTRPPARMRPPTAMSAVLPVFAFLTLAGVLYLVAREMRVPLGMLALAILAISAPLLAWRVRRLKAAPIALPAGRLAA